MTFCPIRLNGGSLPITGPFELDGQVLGPLAARQHIALINYGDPRTCDALGNPPTPGAFIAHGFSMSAPDGRWSFVDSLGYAQAVTIERQFSYVSASPSSIAAMLDDQQTWVAAHPDKADFYPGILKLPSDVRVLATFDVPAGVYEGTQPCQSR